MISNPERNTVLSSMGYVEHDALWHFDASNGTTTTISLDTGAVYASLHCSGTNRFTVAHHFDGRRFEMSVRNFSAPADILARATIDENGESSLVGDLSVWADVPQLYVEYLAAAPWNDFVLLKISPSTGSLQIQRLDWYDDSYDKGYQGVIGVLMLQGTDSAFVSVQRSSKIIVHDLTSGQKIRAIDLGNGYPGNPKLELRDAGKELWARDYDSLVVVRTNDGEILRRARFQGADAGVQQFVGDYSFAPDADLCVVARPFSGDVVGVDPETLKIRQSAELGGQPLELMALPRGDVLARDWKTGALLRGTLKRRWFDGS